MTTKEPGKAGGCDKEVTLLIDTVLRAAVACSESTTGAPWAELFAAVDALPPNVRAMLFAKKDGPHADDIKAWRESLWDNPPRPGWPRCTNCDGPAPCIARACELDGEARGVLKRYAADCEAYTKILRDRGTPGVDDDDIVPIHVDYYGEVMYSVARVFRPR